MRQQLPEEAKRFDNVDKRWWKIMSDAVANPNGIAATSIENRLQDLETLSDDLDKCYKSLSKCLANDALFLDFLSFLTTIYSALWAALTARAFKSTCSNFTITVRA